ncbi:MAG: 16S rRNA (guanine(527)-N(7))-methyltransferase RsmG [Pelagimonas sp.]|uniref:16S rRNA (guanine(527)-N(7))-methyltransferase RsmG n=1 Tax=Pelagimonas sp. TaxID=2073170 RepID=UPI003D6C5627
MIPTSESIGIDVSRETLDRLKLYQELLHKWTRKINLVSPTTVQTSWERHFVDSAQVFELAELETGKWLDLGSGGGFPGMVCAAIAAEKAPTLGFYLVESDVRKVAFLRTVSRELGLDVKVSNKRIEDLDPASSDIVTARALASLKDLLQLSKPHGKPKCRYLFMKGANWKEEVENAQKSWRFSLACHKSKTHSEAVILEIGDITNV